MSERLFAYITLAGLVFVMVVQSVDIVLGWIRNARTYGPFSPGRPIKLRGKDAVKVSVPHTNKPGSLADLFDGAPYRSKLRGQIYNPDGFEHPQTDVDNRAQIGTLPPQPETSGYITVGIEVPPPILDDVETAYIVDDEPLPTWERLREMGEAQRAAEREAK